MTTLLHHATHLHQQAQNARHRALIHIHGNPHNTHQQATQLTNHLLNDTQQPLHITHQPQPNTQHIQPHDARKILGTTHPLIHHNAHHTLDPNTLAAATGTLNHGGLYILTTPPPKQWTHQSPFKTRLNRTIQQHTHTTIHNANTNTLEKQGHLQPPPPTHQTETPWQPHQPRFPPPAYNHTRTNDQARTLHTLEHLLNPPTTITIEAPRGRGKSTALGLAAASLAHTNKNTLITAPHPKNAQTLLHTAKTLLTTLQPQPPTHQNNTLTTHQNATITYQHPAHIHETLHDPTTHAILVDEAASLPVHLLKTIQHAPPPTAYATTTHGYEGQGRGFTLRFKPHLEQQPHPTHHLTPTQPIRYAENDPLERLTYHALLLDANPPPARAIHNATPGSTTYTPLDPQELIENEQRLRETFGLLVHAHYQTTPRDLERLLDDETLHTACLLHDDHVLAAILLQEEGGLSEERCQRLYAGEEINGHLIPDILTTQLRDEQAGQPQGFRIVRIATHPTIQRQGFGTRLLTQAHATFEADWFGTAFGATPGLVRFWDENGYGAVHWGTSRNEASGEHSIVMMQPVTQEGQALVERSTDWFLERIPGVLTDALCGLEVDVVRASLRAVRGDVPVSLSDRAWRHVEGCVEGVGVFDANPAPFRALALKHLVEQQVALGVRAERLLVLKVLQARSWDRVVEALGFDSVRVAKLSLADAFGAIVEAYGVEME